MKEHKHAEVLRAIADGKEVEYFNPEYVEWRPPRYEINPLTYAHLTWRIKPEPKPPIETYKHVHWDEGTIFNHQREPNIRFTFDPDTKLPIKVELI